MFSINAIETHDTITLSGLNKILFNRLVADIRHIWKYRIIEDKLFIDTRLNSITIPKFFAIEFVYMLEKIKESKRIRSSAYTLDNTISTLYADTWLQAINSAVPIGFNYNRLNQLKVKLLPAQMDFLKNYESKVPKYNLKGWMLNAAPGTGKTIAGYAFSLVSESDITIIVSPKVAIKTVWEKTLLTFFNKPKKYWCSATPSKPITGKEDYIICHYEALHYVLGAVNKIRGKKVSIWLDESHNLNDIGSQRTQKFIKLCADVNATHVIWASGTPIKAIGKESIPLLYTIDPLFNDQCAEIYSKIFAKNRSSALDILSHRMGIVTFTVAKSEVVENPRVETTRNVHMPNGSDYTLPKIQQDIIEFVKERTTYYQLEMSNFESEFFDGLDKFKAKYAKNMTRDVQKEYDLYIYDVNKMHKSFNFKEDLQRINDCKVFEKNYIYPTLNDSDRKKFKKVASIYKYVSLTIKGEALGRILTKRRVQCFKDMVDYAYLPELIDASEKKTLIFTSYIDVAEKLNESLVKDGYKPIVIYGNANKQITKHMANFKTDPHANPIIATYDSLSTAVPVIEANTCILFNLPFREYIRNQATSRVDRYGQDAIVRIVEVLLDTGDEMNISTRSGEILQWSQEQVNMILGTDSSSDKAVIDGSLN